LEHRGFSQADILPRRDQPSIVPTAARNQQVTDFLALGMFNASQGPTTPNNLLSYYLKIPLPPRTPGDHFWQLESRSRSGKEKHQGKFMAEEWDDHKSKLHQSGRTNVPRIRWPSCVMLTFLDTCPCETGVGHLVSDTLTSLLTSAYQWRCACQMPAEAGTLCGVSACRSSA
jgi:hypothetical protein